MPPKFEEWKQHFPVGPWISGSSVNQRARDNTNNVVSVSPTNSSQISAVLDHPEQGIRANHMNYSSPAAQPNNYEDVQGIPALYDATVPMHKMYPAIDGKTITLNDPPTGIINDWFARTSATQTYADAVTFVTPIVQNFEAHPCILGYRMYDDVAVSNGRAEPAMTLMKAMQDIDAYGRPVMPVIGHQSAFGVTYADSMKMALFYRYPCGKTTGAIIALEGDFHRNTFDAIGDLGGGGDDWVDALRQWIALMPASCEGRWHNIIQTHKTADSTASLRYPTALEFRKQFWISVGEGAKGIWWFTWGGDDESIVGTPWYGFGDVNKLAHMQVAGELSHRLNPVTRAALLKCNRVSDLFTTSGGGSAGYPVNYANAYKSTLQDAQGNTYLTLCNHSLSTATVTVTSATLTGRLVNMHDGTIFKIGGTVSLPPLDGGVWRYDPYIGVPRWDTDHAVGVETWWSTHWANSASVNYVAVGSIKTHTNVVDLASGADLQTIINAGPNNTTYRLAAGGTYNGTVEIYGKKGIHIIAANPASKPTVRRIHFYGAEMFRRYAREDGVIDKLMFKTDPGHAAALTVWDNPKSDFLLKNLNFVSDGELLYYLYYQMADTTWQRDHYSSGNPIWIRNVRDVCVEGCSFTGYDTSEDPRDPDTTGGIQDPPTATGAPSTHHNGLIGGNAGLTNIIFRNNVCDATASGTRGWPYVFFIDGGRGCCMISNTCTGKFSKGCVAYLTNDDFTSNVRFDGDNGVGLKLDREVRNAQFSVVYDNDFPQTNGPVVAIAGMKSLVKGNRGIGIVPRFAYFTVKCSKNNSRGHYYNNFDNVVDGNTVTGNCSGGFVETEVDTGDCDMGATYPFRSRLGRTTVKNNTVTGTLTAGANTWLRPIASPVQVGTTETPDVVTGNSPA